MSEDSVRIPPSAADAITDVVDGMDLLARRQLYAGMHAAGLAATAEADRRYPFDGMPLDAAANRAYLDRRRQVNEENKAEERKFLQDLFLVAADQLARVEAEGDRERWPSRDGLSDAQGPIPTFGPAATDAWGHIVMGEPERAARRYAVLRALHAVRRITDATDADPAWDELPARFGGAS